MLISLDILHPQHNTSVKEEDILDTILFYFDIIRLNNLNIKNNNSIHNKMKCTHQI